MNPTTYLFTYNGKQLFSIRSVIQPCQIGDSVSNFYSDDGILYVKSLELADNRTQIIVRLGN